MKSRSGLSAIIEKYGPESLAVSTLQVNTAVDQGTLRRFMNALGSPNWISGLSMCMGNTAQVHRATLGWYLSADYTKANCIVYLGHNPHQQNWVAEYREMLAAKERGAKLIVADPRLSHCAQMADLYIPLRYGTDAALLLGWLNVIIEEGLYKKSFVKKWTVGFDDLCQRVHEYTPDRVAEICGIDADLVRTSARMYVTEGPSIIPWTVNFDMSKNSTSLIRCHCILAAICGYVNVSEMLAFPSPDIVTISDVEMHEILPEEKKRIQLGTETYPFFTYTGLAPLEDPTEHTYGKRYRNVLASYMAHPPTVFEAMRTGKPYPIKAFFAMGNNTLLSYANQQGILEGLMNQELIVVFDNFLTPTAQLADYVLPGDTWLERPCIFPPMDVAPMAIASQQAIEPKGEAKDEYFVIKGLADRMGLGEYFPWENLIEFMEWRIKSSGQTWEEYSQTFLHMPSKMFAPNMMRNPIVPTKWNMVKLILSMPFVKPAGFATPSGKVELKSSLLERMGYDPLPYYDEPDQTPRSNPELAREYPLTLFIGLREDPYYNTNLRQVEGLRKRLPDPLTLINPVDGGRYGIEEGQWVEVSTTHGSVTMKAHLDEIQPEGTIRVPHGWWYAEKDAGTQGEFSGAMRYNDGMLIPDEPWNLDPAQGLPNLRGGLLAKVAPCAM